MFTAKLMKTYTKGKNNTTEIEQFVKRGVLLKYKHQQFNNKTFIGLFSYH